jgi:deoxyribodipyrimidine photolyase-related protein
LHRNRDKLAGNPRMAQMYRTWDRMDEDKQRAYLDSAANVLAAL